jgi:hypothetical protein
MKSKQRQAALDLAIGPAMPPVARASGMLTCG